MFHASVVPGVSDKHTRHTRATSPRIATVAHTKGGKEERAAAETSLRWRQFKSDFFASRVERDGSIISGWGGQRQYEEQEVESTFLTGLVVEPKAPPGTRPKPLSLARAAAATLNDADKYYAAMEANKVRYNKLEKAVAEKIAAHRTALEQAETLERFTAEDESRLRERSFERVPLHSTTEAILKIRKKKEQEVLAAASLLPAGELSPEADELAAHVDEIAAYKVADRAPEMPSPSRRKSVFTGRRTSVVKRRQRSMTVRRPNNDSDDDSVGSQKKTRQTSVVIKRRQSIVKANDSDSSDSDDDIWNNGNNKRTVNGSTNQRTSLNRGNTQRASKHDLFARRRSMVEAPSSRDMMPSTRQPGSRVMQRSMEQGSNGRSLSFTSGESQQQQQPEGGGAKRLFQKAREKRVKKWLLLVWVGRASAQYEKNLKLIVLQRKFHFYIQPAILIQTWIRQLFAPKPTMKSAFRAVHFTKLLKHGRIATRAKAVKVMRQFLESNIFGQKISRFIANITPATKRLQEMWRSFALCTKARARALSHLWDSLEHEIALATRKKLVEEAVLQLRDLEFTTPLESSITRRRGPQSAEGLEQERAEEAQSDARKKLGVYHAQESDRMIWVYARVMAPLGRERRYKPKEAARRVAESLAHSSATSTGMRSKINLTMVQENLKSKLDDEIAISASTPNADEAKKLALLTEYLREERIAYKHALAPLQELLSGGARRLDAKCLPIATVQDAKQLLCSFQYLDQKTGLLTMSHKSAIMIQLEAQETRARTMNLNRMAGQRNSCYMPRGPRMAIYSQIDTKRDLVVMIQAANAIAKHNQQAAGKTVEGVNPFRNKEHNEHQPAISMVIPLPNRERRLLLLQQQQEEQSVIATLAASDDDDDASKKTNSDDDDDDDDGVPGDGSATARAPSR